MVRSQITIEHALLGFMREQPTHGYDIYRQLSDPAGLGIVWRLKRSQLYALLGKLEAEGYISAMLEPQEARPPRKVFHLTAEGREAFEEWMQSPVAHGRQLRLDFLARLYFARREGRQAAAQLIDRQRAACRQWLTTEQAKADEVRDTRPYDWLVHEFRAGQIRAMLDWLDTCEQTQVGSIAGLVKDEG
ncbi:MAG TPA: helix-turn-helix transcriptional regulator [Anaerolineae bacterium]